jgi:glycosyltransferase involved in cell wall biosynthesis
MMGDQLVALFVVPSARRAGGGDVWLDSLLGRLGKHGISAVALFEEDGELVRRARERGCAALVAAGNADRGPCDPGELVRPVADVIARREPAVTVFWSPRAQVYGARAHALAGGPGRTAWVQHVLPSRFWLHQAASDSPSDLVICVSRAVQARQEHLYPHCPTAVIRPGIDLPAPALPRLAARQALGISSSAPTIGVVGRIEPWKGQDIAVRMLAGMRGKTCSLVLVGDRHSASWPEFAPELDALATELGVTDRVAFTGHRGDAAVLLHGLDILVCASREEGFGLAVLEATAAGVPVVATRCGGPEDVIEHGVTGLLVPAEDPVALAGAVEQLLASPQLATRMTARAKARYREEFTGDHGAARFTGAIRALASGKPPQAP